MKTKNYTKEYLLWIIRELREEIRQCRFGVRRYRTLIEKEKKKLINTKIPHDNLWGYRFRLGRLETTIRKDKKELKRYEVEYGRRFNPTKPLPIKRKLIYDRGRWKGRSDLEILQFYLDKYQDCLL